MGQKPAARMVDGTQIKQVFLNLLLNASSDASGGKLTVRIHGWR